MSARRCRLPFIERTLPASTLIDSLPITYYFNHFSPVGSIVLHGGRLTGASQCHLRRETAAAPNQHRSTPTHARHSGLTSHSHPSLTFCTRPSLASPASSSPFAAPSLTLYSATLCPQVSTLPFSPLLPFSPFYTQRFSNHF